MRNLRRGFVVGVCVVAVAFGVVIAVGSSALGDWEELPNPPIDLPSTWLSRNDNFWNFPSGIFSLCLPFLVSDDQSNIYIGASSTFFEYDQFLSYNTLSAEYQQLSPPPPPQANITMCIDASGNGEYVDGNLYFYAPFHPNAMVYDVSTQNWNASAISAVMGLGTITFFSDLDKETLYWSLWPVWTFKYDPDHGWSALRFYDYASSSRGFSRFSIMNNKIYYSGGFYMYYSKSQSASFGSYYGTSSADALAFDLVAWEPIPMRAVPNETAMIGVAWGAGGAHYLGFTLKGISPYYYSFPIMEEYYVRRSEVYYYIYNPASDEWQTLPDEYPPDCLPIAATGQGTWLYALFGCIAGDDAVVKYYRKDIGIYDWSTTTTTSTTSTTTTSTTSTTQPLDDDSDDDALDDDAGDDDAGDDDTTSPDADAPADGDDGDDGCGC
ncbi:MAG: hypothetical protein IT350_07305 [Deltaproteobacteria bacterium]|nr:hypothetical protein [Deltaproteobacteria bacterium]